MGESPTTRRKRRSSALWLKPIYSARSLIRQVVDPSGRLSLLEPGNRRSDQRVRFGQTDPGEQEGFKKLYATYMVLGFDQLFTELHEFLGASEDLCKISGRPGKLIERWAQKGSGTYRRKLRSWGAVDIPFTRAIREVLLEEHLAAEHRWVPNSGWTTFQIRSDKDLEHALWLMQLSYLRYALKAEAQPSDLLQKEIKRLHLSPRLASLLEQFVPTRRTAAGVS